MKDMFIATEQSHVSISVKFSLVPILSGENEYM